jgi:hypothetical protein
MMMEENQTPSLWQVAKSVMAAMLGVQKSENFQRDFQYGKPRQYIILGLVFVILFILILVGIVNLVLSLTGV